MAHDAEYDFVQGEQHRLLGEAQSGMGLGAGELRWVCGATPHAGEPIAARRRGVGSDFPESSHRPSDPAGSGAVELGTSDLAAAEADVAGRRTIEWEALERGIDGVMAGRTVEPTVRVPRQRDSDRADGEPTRADSRSECRMQRLGWAVAHRHGAVRPRSRVRRRERPPHRWC